MSTVRIVISVPNARIPRFVPFVVFLADAFNNDKLFHWAK